MYAIKRVARWVAFFYGQTHSKIKIQPRGCKASESLTNDLNEELTALNEEYKAVPDLVYSRL